LEIKRIRSDNGGEYVGKEFQGYLKEQGIIHEFTNSYSPEQNGVAERLNRTLNDKARCMLENAKLPKQFWAEAVRTANHIRNNSTCKPCGNKTPMELWTDYTPNVSYFKIFGCTAYANIPKAQQLGKYGARAVKTIFLGYPDDRKGYRLWNPKTKRIVNSRDVKFDERLFSGGVIEETESDRKLDKSKFTTFDMEDISWLEEDQIVEPENQERSELENIIGKNQEDNLDSDLDTTDNDSIIETEEIESDRRILRPRTSKVKPVKYSAFMKLDEEEKKEFTSEDCMFLYGPYPGYRIQ
jgi:hypothetical protein